MCDARNFYLRVNTYNITLFSFTSVKINTKKRERFHSRFRIKTL